MWLGVVCLLLWMQTPDSLERGRQALEQNHPADAVPLLQQAVATAPNDYAAHFHLALALSLTGRDAEALPEYRKTLELQPHLYQADLNAAILLVRAKDYKAALPLAEDARQQKPREFRPNYYLGEARLGAQDAAGAAEAFRGALEADPRSAAAELGLGRALARSHQLEAAAPHFEKAAELKPEFKDAPLELAAEYEQAHLAAPAIAIYQRFPGNPAAQERLGQLLIESRQFAAAIPRLEQAVAAAPTAANRLALAAAYRDNKEPAKAIDMLTKAAAENAGDFEIRMALARALRDQRQLVPAANQFLAATKLKPDSAEAWNELAAVLLVHRDYEAGLAALDHVKALGAEKPGDFFLRAITLDKLKQREPALASYRQFLASAGGRFPDEEFQARQRARILEREISKR